MSLSREEGRSSLQAGEEENFKKCGEIYKFLVKTGE